MTAQGNPQLYARQKAKHLTLILLASLRFNPHDRCDTVVHGHRDAVDI